MSGDLRERGCVDRVWVNEHILSKLEHGKSVIVSDDSLAIDQE
jgi:hypothetical protein